MKKLFFAISLILNTFYSHGQTVEWGKAHINASSVAKITVDSENNSYLLAGGLGQIAKNTPVPKPTTIVKYNEVGQKCWEHYSKDYFILDTKAEANTCDLYSLAVITTATTIGGKDYNVPQNVNWLILLKTDSAFNIQWSRIISDSVYISNNSNTESGANKLFISDNAIIIKHNIGNYFRYKGINYTKFDNNGLPVGRKAIIRLDKAEVPNNTLEWIVITKNIIATLYNQSSSTDDSDIDKEGNIYMLVRKGLGQQTLYNNTQINLSNNQNSILKISGLNGTLIKKINFSDSTSLSNICILPNNKIFLGGSFLKEFKYNNTELYSNFRINFNCLLDSSGKLLWINSEDSIGEQTTMWYPYSRYKNGSIYWAGTTRGKASFKSFSVDTKDSASINNPEPMNQTLMKIDTLGNILWFFLIHTSGLHILSEGFDVDYNGNPIILAKGEGRSSTTNILGTIIPDSPLPYSLNFTTFLYKLSDFAIFRGNVYEGPYCAGDTIEIPFTKRGIFKQGNEFIAQLSNEDGEFIGKERELGRLTDTENGVIKGLLPLFNVNTSGNYRIRILATKPAVQSYYRQDSLRLLVYSRDTANAGDDTLICNGQSVQLGTTGGSKWEWSPAVSLNDSKLFKPIATPITNTLYRIIISDSSGCGNTDTDYVWVRVRKPLNIKTPFTDSTICKGQIIQLYAKGTGGDSLNHSLQWYERRNLGNIALNSATDSLLINYVQKLRTFFVVLEDGCTARPDTQFYTISIFDKLKADFRLINRRLEVEEPIVFQSTSKEATKYQWDLGDGILNYGKSKESKVYEKAGEKTIILVAENSLGCKDTAYKTIRVFEKVYCSIPNAFTPNRDGLNNNFAPECIGISNYTLTIYNRWGQVIFQQENGAWDGTYIDKPVPEGLYMYKIHFFADNKNKSMVYGSVNVIR